MPFAATWMDLEIIILNEVSQRQVSQDITYIEPKKNNNNTNELIYRIEKDLQTQKTNLWLPKEKEDAGGKLGDWDQQIQTIIYKVDKQQAPTIYIAQGTVL